MIRLVAPRIKRTSRKVGILGKLGPLIVVMVRRIPRTLIPVTYAGRVGKGSWMRDESTILSRLTALTKTTRHAGRRTYVCPRGGLGDICTPFSIQQSAISVPRNHVATTGWPESKSSSCGSAASRSGRATTARLAYLPGSRLPIS